MKIYDVVIIGAGPAGITAGIYAKNFGLDCLIIGEETGGLINAAFKVENYPGIFNVTGKELTEKFKAHQKYLKIPLIKDRVELIQPQQLRGEKIFQIFSKKKEYKAKTIVLAFGTETKKINIKNVDKFEGKGVHYRVDDDAFLPRTKKKTTHDRGHSKSLVRGLYKNKTVAVVGGANAAAMSAVALAEKARKVYLIYRKSKLRADAIWVNKVKKLKNVEVIYDANVVEVKGNLSAGRHGNWLEKIILDNGKIIEGKGLLIEAGCVPNTYFIHDLGIKIDKQGYIKVDKTQATNISGIFAAGDATTSSNEFRQIVTACSEAAIAVLGVFNFLKKQ